MVADSWIDVEVCCNGNQLEMTVNIWNLAANCSRISHHTLQQRCCHFILLLYGVRYPGKRQQFCMPLCRSPTWQYRLGASNAFCCLKRDPFSINVETTWIYLIWFDMADAYRTEIYQIRCNTIYDLLNAAIIVVKLIFMFVVRRLQAAEPRLVHKCMHAYIQDKQSITTCI